MMGQDPRSREIGEVPEQLSREVHFDEYGVTQDSRQSFVLRQSTDCSEARVNVVFNRETTDLLLEFDQPVGS
jgi:hypothetical protein